MFLSEVAHRSFSAKFSELTQKNHKSTSIHTYRVIFGLFLKDRKSTFQEKKDLWCADKAFRIILL